MRRLFANTLLAGVVCLGLAGCSGGSDATEDGTPDVAATDLAADLAADVSADPGPTDVAPPDVVDTTPDPGTADVQGTDEVEADLPPATDTAVDDPGPVDSADVSEFPSTPVGLQMTWFVTMVNGLGAGTYTLTQEDYDAHFSEAVRAAYTLYAFRTAVLAPYAYQYAPIELQGYEDSATDTAMYARAHAGGPTQIWLRLYLRLEADTGLIEGLARTPSPDLDPAFGPLGATQVGVFPFDPYMAKKTAGFVVEAVDRATGLPLDPPVVATADATYGYARLTLPAGTGEVGAKLTHSDGQVTYNFGANLKPGGDYLSIAAYPSAAFPAYVAKVGTTVVAGKAQVWGYAFYDAGTALWSVEPYQVGIGCATVTADPAVDRIYYTAPPTYFPAADAPWTAVANSTWYSFNVEPGAHTFTAQSTGAPLVVSAVPLVADAISVVFMGFDAATYPANPTPADCAP